MINRQRHCYNIKYFSIGHYGYTTYGYNVKILTDYLKMTCQVPKS